MRHLFAAILLAATALIQSAAAETLTVTTVTRPPFSMQEDGIDTGFSIELLEALATSLHWDYQIDRMDQFGDMLDAVSHERADLAIANISITSAREVTMDFSQPIFEAGLQIMVPVGSTSGPSLMRALMSPDLVLAIGAAFLLLLGGGMLMWLFERRAQPYFDRPVHEAWFPSFWWALNLVVNGGFEERVPRTIFGRVFGVVLVVSSLFIVSVFVAKITAVMTVNAISGSVNSVNDLYGKQVATIEGSTAAGFLDRREIGYAGFSALAPMLQAFEQGDVDAIVFDAPILAHYVTHAGRDFGSLAGPVFLRENYGIAFTSGSPLVEDANQALLALRENGTYEQIYRKWFGAMR
ncbi:transporter substrate-binding domain-containing protein [Pseudodonghicola flavimaris]|uniref:Transporter substrate-binding domain-containing protein n=1 Tax=Pseudodonghicola flavimaris TaxID=3050036 RepID=A0ABT7EZF3_9RHOB|nr:transporter substrate-binding domain-containing protein [Pseudodonghicola flavimaris]MDK3017717.1 transporter substrate-binding domain-containing protein [Pseudodonghicola flavimaris]